MEQPESDNLSLPSISKCESTDDENSQIQITNNSDELNIYTKNEKNYTKFLAQKETICCKNEHKKSQLLQFYKDEENGFDLNFISIATVKILTTFVVIKAKIKISCVRSKLSSQKLFLINIKSKSISNTIKNVLNQN